MDTIGKRIKRVRKEKGLTQEALGNILKITKSSVSLLESDKNHPSDQTTTLFCEKLGVNREWFVNGGSDNEMFYPEFENDELSTYFADLTDGKDPRIVEMLLKYRKLSPQHKQALWEIYDELTKKEDV